MVRKKELFLLLWEWELGEGETKLYWLRVKGTGTGEGETKLIDKSLIRDPSCWSEARTPPGRTAGWVTPGRGLPPRMREA